MFSDIPQVLDMKLVFSGSRRYLDTHSLVISCCFCMYDCMLGTDLDEELKGIEYYNIGPKFVDTSLDALSWGWMFANWDDRILEG